MKHEKAVRNNVRENRRRVCHLLVCVLVLFGLSFCLIACGSKNGNGADGVKIIEGEGGKYYDITYDDFVEELGTPLTYAAGSDSKSDVKGIVNTCKDLGKSMTSIDGYSQQVFVREIIFYMSDTYGFSLRMFYMNVYSTLDEDKIVRVEISKNNMKDYYQSDRNAFLDRFNGIANGVTKLLSGKQVSDYGTEFKYKASDTNTVQSTHYFRYNDSEVVFGQQEAMMGDQRHLTIMPAYETSAVGTQDEETSSSVQTEEEVTPAWTLPQEELQEAFMNSMCAVEVYTGEFTISVNELLEDFMADYEINYYKLEDEDIEEYLYLFQMKLDELEYEYNINPEYVYAAVVSGNVFNHIDNSDSVHYNQAAFGGFMIFNESGELTESFVILDDGSLLQNIYELTD